MTEQERWLPAWCDIHASHCVRWGTGASFKRGDTPEPWACAMTLANASELATLLNAKESEQGLLDLADNMHEESSR